MLFEFHHWVFLVACQVMLLLALGKVCVLEFQGWVRGGGCEGAGGAMRSDGM